eukprot:1176093-Prorocentrum_minimum.AAC.3
MSRSIKHFDRTVRTTTQVIDPTSSLINNLHVFSFLDAGDRTSRAPQNLREASPRGSVGGRRPHRQGSVFPLGLAIGITAGPGVFTPGWTIVRVNVRRQLSIALSAIILSPRIGGRFKYCRLICYYNLTVVMSST